MAQKNHAGIKRREFIKATAAGLAVLPAFSIPLIERRKNKEKTTVALVKSGDRKHGVRETLRLLEFPPPSGKEMTGS